MPEGLVRRFPVLLLLAAWPGAALLNAAQESGYVYAADQPIPGATVTARQGDTKVVAYSDENGRYVLNLGPGMWDLTVEILGLTPARQQVTVGDQAGVKDFTMEMPKYGQAPVPETGVAASGAPATAAATTSPAGTTPGQGGRGRGRGGLGGGQGRGGPGGLGRGGPGGGAAGAGRSGSAAGAAPVPGFQNAQVTATQEGQDALAAAAAAGPSALGAGDDTGDQAFLVSGSTSDGLGAASDFERQRQQGGGRGGPGGGPGGGAGDAASALGIPPGMSALDNSNLGLGGLGADAINGGFGGGAAAGGGGAGFGGGGGGRGGGGGGGGGGGRGGGGRGGGGGGGARGGGRGGRGNPNASFGNRRRNTRPAYTGSIALTLANSALNAAPFSLNGTPAAKPSSDRANYVGNLAGPMIIPKILNWQRAQFQLNYQGTTQRSASSNLSEVPTPDQQNGIFTGLKVANNSVAIYDPTSAAPGVPAQQFMTNAGLNVIPPTRLDPNAMALLQQFYPQPTYTIGPSCPAPCTQNYRLVASPPTTGQNMGVRLNAPLNNKDRLNFNIQYQGRNSVTQQLFGFRDTGTGYGTSASIGWNHSFAPRFNNVATVSYSRNVTQSNPYFANNTAIGDVAQYLHINENVASARRTGGLRKLESPVSAR